ncbi:MAG: aldolase/citrate lyase family protein, partial [Candidatus Fonsibacter sp.]
INLEQAQRIIAANQAFNVPCLPRPVSHSNDWIKPLLESGADGLVAPMVNSKSDAKQLIQHIKYPPNGKRSFGVNRAQNYGSSFSEYIALWNEQSVFMAQIESKEGVENLTEILKVEDV